MASHASQKPVAIWLLLCCGAVFCMVVLGGITRLTGSGLSMVEWEPVTGILPPMSREAWEEVFLLYQAYPEYRLKNFGMSLGEFKTIFWFEYAHRLLGRIIGILFLLPFLFFAFTGRIDRSLSPKLILMFVLGGLQGLLGWYMVKSGLVQDPHVSQYRLTAHLGLALLIYAFMLWVAMDLLYPRDARRPDAWHRRGRPLLPVLIPVLVMTTALSGGFVAGTHAGQAYNTFPLMDGKWIPDGLLTLDPIWRNFFENVTTVQFDHRVLAALVFFSILAYWWSARRLEAPGRLRVGIHLLLVAACIQVALGISTLLLQVPTALGAAHQAGALALLTLSLFTAHQHLRLGSDRGTVSYALEGAR